MTATTEKPKRTRKTTTATTDTKPKRTRKTTSTATTDTKPKRTRKTTSTATTDTTTMDTTAAASTKPTLERARNVSALPGVFIPHSPTALFDCDMCGAKDVNASHYEETRCAIKYWCDRNTAQYRSEGYVRLDDLDLDPRFLTDLVPTQDYCDDNTMIFAISDFKIDPTTGQHEGHFRLWLRPDWASYMVEVARVYGKSNSEKMAEHHKEFMAASADQRKQMYMRMSLLESEI